MATETLHHKAWDDIPSCAPINNADCTVWTLETAQLDSEEHCWPLPQPYLYNQIQGYSFYLFTHVFYLKMHVRTQCNHVNNASMLTLVIKPSFVHLTSMSEVTKAALWPFMPTPSGPSIPSCWSVQSVTEPTCSCSPPDDHLECNCKTSVLVNTFLKWMVFSELMFTVSHRKVDLLSITHYLCMPHSAMHLWSLVNPYCSLYFLLDQHWRAML